MKQEEIEPYWTKAAEKVLLGKTINQVFYMTPEDMETMGWYERGLVIRFTDGTEILVSQDDEGNGPGSLFTSSEEHPTLPVIS